MNQTNTNTKTIAQELRAQLTIPVIASPMFIVSNPALVIAQCQAGIVGSFPALNARPAEKLGEWLDEITKDLAADKKANPTKKVAPYAVNQIVHTSNPRLEHDIAVCKQYKVPLTITSLSAPGDVVKEAHGWGGKVFHDVISVRHAQKALEAGVDGLILVCAGAGGHAGTLSPFALLAEIRAFYDGVVILSGAITNGRAILAAEAMGADFAYMGTRFICTTEANAVPDYKNMIVDSKAQDIVYTPFFTGVHGNYLKKSIIASGLNPDELPTEAPKLDFAKRTQEAKSSSEHDAPKAWKTIWGAGQGVGDINTILPTADLVQQLTREYQSAKKALLEN